MRARLPPGPDPRFPYLDEGQRYAFPDPDTAAGALIAIGGNLSPGMLLSAYERGIFPWFNEGDPILWQSPDPRFVLFPERLHVSASMRKALRRGDFTVTFDRDFAGVIAGCAEAPRPGQGGTWITGDMRVAYTELHRLGYAHSAEAWQDGELAGGCYGVLLPKHNPAFFFGESMFTRRPNASKAAFLTLAQKLFADGVRLIDCQVYTKHLASLGAEEITRSAFLRLLRAARAMRQR